MHRGFAQGIAQNRIGLEVALGANETYDVVNYSRNMRLKVQEMMEERVRMQVNSTDPEGRVISINLDNTSLELRERQRLRIHYDEEPLNCIDNPEAVLNGTGQPLSKLKKGFSVFSEELIGEEEEAQIIASISKATDTILEELKEINSVFLRSALNELKEKKSIEALEKFIKEYVKETHKKI